MSVIDLFIKNQCGLLSPELYCSSAKLDLLGKLDSNKFIRSPNSEYDGIKLFCNRLYWWTIDSGEMMVSVTLRDKVYDVGNISPRIRIPCGGTAAPSSVDAREHILTASGGGCSLHVIDPTTLVAMDDIRHPKAVTHQALAVLDPFLVAAGSNEGCVYVSDLRTGSQILTLNRSKESWQRKVAGTPKVGRHCVAWSPVESRILLSLMNGITPLQAIDIRRPNVALKHFTSCDYDGVDFPIPTMAYVGDTVATVCNDYSIRIYEVTTGSLIQTVHRYKCHSRMEELSPVLIMSTSPQVLLMANSKSLTATTIGTNQSLASVHGHFGRRNFLQFDQSNFDLYWLDSHKVLNTFSLHLGHAPFI